MDNESGYSVLRANIVPRPICGCLMLFGRYKSTRVSQIIFDGYFIASSLLGLASIFSFFANTNVLAVLTSSVYFGTSTLLSTSKNFRKSPFSILICIFSFLFLNIPIAFIIFQGQSYTYGTGLASLPYEQGDYQQSLPLGLLYLTCFWVAIWLGIVLAGRRQRVVNRERPGTIALRLILLLGVFVMYVTWIENSNFADVRLNVSDKENSLIAFVFFDHAYLVLVGVLLLEKLNDSIPIVNSRKISFLFSAIFIGFVFIYFIAGSKAAILVIINLLVIYPLCVAMGDNLLNVQFLKPSAILFCMLLAFPMFYFALIQRISLESGIPPSVDTFLSGASRIDFSSLSETVSQIVYRFSQGGVDRFLLIFQSFIAHGFDWETSRQFAIYLFKNTVNLLFLGTPFPEAYVPSSQLFQQVIENKDLVGSSTLSEFIHSMNTQPYTLFGTGVVLFGVFSPIFLCLFTFFFVLIFNKVSNHFLHATMIYFFAGALSSYGIESVVGNSFHLLISMVLMYGLLRILAELSSARLYIPT